MLNFPFCIISNCLASTNLEEWQNISYQQLAAASLNSGKEAVTKKKETLTPTINESWYFLLNSDFSIPIYDESNLKSKVSHFLESLDSYDTQNIFEPDNLNSFYLLAFAAAKGELGLYWPNKSLKTMYGFNVNGFQIELRSSGLSLRLRQYGGALSMYRFFGANIGDGYFFKADLGFAAFDSKVFGEVIGIETTDEVRQIYEDFHISYLGVSTSLGMGYAHSIGRETRLLWGFGVTLNNFEGLVSLINLNLGILF